MAPDTELNRVCFVCWKESSSLNSDRDPVLYSKFISFVHQYLQVEGDKAEEEFEGFCDPCAKRVSLVCKLFKELCAVELHLSSKLKELGKLIKESDKQEVCAPLKNKKRKAEELRKQIFIKCFQKCGLSIDDLEGECGPEPEETLPNDHEDIKPDLEALQHLVHHSIFIPDESDLHSQNQSHLGDEHAVTNDDGVDDDDDDDLMDRSQEDESRCDSFITPNSPFSDNDRDDDRQAEDEDEEETHGTQENSVEDDSEASETDSGSDSDSSFQPSNDEYDDDDGIKSEPESSDDDDDEEEEEMESREEDEEDDSLAPLTFTRKRRRLGNEQLHSKAMQSPRKIGRLPRAEEKQPQRKGVRGRPLETFLAEGFECEICGEMKNSAVTLKRHLRSHESSATSKQYPCTFCKRTFFFELKRKMHIESQHKSLLLSTSTFYCDDIEDSGCTASFQTVAELNFHLKSHSKPILFCSEPECEASFVSQEYLKIHEILHIKRDNKNGTRKFPCPFPSCPTRKGYHKELQSHYNLQHGYNLQIFRCSRCNLRFSSDFSLATHLKNHDDPTKTIAQSEPLIHCCEICRKKWPTIEKLQRHMFRHEETATEKPFPCSFCNRSYAYEPNRTLHTQRIHNQISKSHFKKFKGSNITSSMFFCDDGDADNDAKCLASFETQAELNTHLETHSKPIYFCTEVDCQAGFLTPEFLKLHQILHIKKEGITNECKGFFHCPFPACPTKLPFKKELQTHYNKNHGHHLRFLKCPECQQRFSSTKLLIAHTKNHPTTTTSENPSIQCNKILEGCGNNPKPFFCDDGIHADDDDESRCRASFKSQPELNAHLETHSKPIHFCSEECCQAGFLNPELLTLHQILHLKEERTAEQDGIFYACPYSGCRHKTSHNRRLQSHYNNRHGHRLKYLKCPECEQRFSSATNLMLHVSNHDDPVKAERSSTCPHCQRQFPSWLSVRKHEFRCKMNPNPGPKNPSAIKDRTPANPWKEYKCEVCNEVVVGMINFRLHVRNTHPGKLKPDEHSVCHVCGDSFSNSSALKAHIHNLHGAGKFVDRRRKKPLDFVCATCGKAYTNKLNLARHEMAHIKGEMEKKFECHLCPRKFCQKNPLKNHLRKVHCKEKGQEFTPGEGAPRKDQKCLYPSCPQAFFEETELRAHVERVHLQSHHQFMCINCGRTFENLQRLTRHGAVHTEKQFKCHICEKNYSLQQTLREHLTQVHGEGNPKDEWPCTQPSCNSKFKCEKYLKSHLRLVHGILAGGRKVKKEEDESSSMEMEYEQMM